jgi:Outer membrane protein Omp28
MKKNLNSISFLILVSFFFILISCDKIEQPYEQEVVNGPINGVEIKSDSSKILIKKVLLEDYTGHKCGNCPKALDTVATIESAYPDQVITVSIHSGYYSTFSSAPYKYNWIVESPTKPGYNALDEFFQISDQGNPNGMVNRKDYDIINFSHVKGIDTWKTAVASELSTPLKATIYLTNIFDATNNNLKTTAKIKFLSSLSGSFKIATMLLEDHVACDTSLGRTVPQKDYRINPDDDYDYVHKHVLRDYLYGAFGDSLKTNPNANDTLTKVYTKNINLKKNSSDTAPYYINADDLYVVVYIYNASTYEVIQTEKLKIKP